jgi:hypothetical protein
MWKKYEKSDLQAGRKKAVPKRDDGCYRASAVRTYRRVQRPYRGFSIPHAAHQFAGELQGGVIGLGYFFR